MFSRNKKNRNNTSLFENSRTEIKNKRGKIDYKEYFSKIKEFFIDSKTGKYSILGIILIPVFLFLISILGPYFRIETINIVRDDPNIDINLSYNAMDNFRNKSIIFLDSLAIKNSLESYQPQIMKMSLIRNYPKEISINLESFPEYYNTIFGEKKYIITQNGVYVPSTNIEFESIPLKIIGNLGVNIPDYKVILDEEILAKIKYIEETLLTKFLLINISEIKFYLQNRTVHFVLNTGTTAIFDLEQTYENLDLQLEKLSIFQNDSESALELINYIDLRISSKIFYCEKEIETICQNNLKSVYGEI